MYLILIKECVQTACLHICVIQIARGNYQEYVCVYLIV